MYQQDSLGGNSKTVMIGKTSTYFLKVFLLMIRNLLWLLVLIVLNEQYHESYCYSVALVDFSMEVNLLYLVGTS